MTISKEDALHVAKLARLKLQNEEVELYTAQLNNILDYAQELQQVETKNIEPTFHPVPAKEFLREDTVKEFANKQAIIANGPDVSGTSFVVPKIV